MVFKFFGNLEHVADDSVTGDTEYRGFRIGIHGNDVFDMLHAPLMLNRTGDAHRDIEPAIRRLLAGLTYLTGFRQPTVVGDRP